jgi:hypothetical protein
VDNATAAGAYEPATRTFKLCRSAFLREGML